jgi:hypothetical protein
VNLTTIQMRLEALLHAILPDSQPRGHEITTGHASGEELELLSDGAKLHVYIPVQGIGLTLKERGNPIFLLRTNLGSIQLIDT